MLLWNSSYEVGNRFIDAEHKILFELANELASHKVDNLEKFKEIYLDLLQYTNLHFLNEELLLKDIGFDHLLGHSHKHQEIILEMRSLVEKRHTLSELKIGLIECLQRWIANHILREDMAYRPALAAWKRKRLGFGAAE